MDIAALIAALTSRIPDLVSVIPGPTDWSDWLDVSNEHYALTIERTRHTGKWGIYYPDTDEAIRSYKENIAGPDEVLDDALQLVDRIVSLFEEAEADKLLMVACVNGRDVFLPRRVSYAELVRCAPFGRPELHLYTVTYTDADGRAGSLKQGQSVRLGKRTIINVARTDKA